MTAKQTKQRSGGAWARGFAALAMGAAVLLTMPASVWGQSAKPNAATLQQAARHAEESRKLADQGKLDAAVSSATRALIMSAQALGSEHPHVAQSLNDLAVLYHRKGDFTKAELLHRRALSIREKALGSQHLSVGVSLFGLAEAYYGRGHYDEAEPLYLRALPIWENALGSEHPHVTLFLKNLADLYRMKGDYARAEPFQQRVVAFREKALGPEHLDVAAALDSLAFIYDDKNDYAKAESLYMRALSIREKKLGREHPEVATALGHLAGLYQHQRDYAKAEAFQQRALAIREKALGPEHPDVAISLNNLAGLYHNKLDYAKAEAMYQRGLAIRVKALGPEHPDVAASLNNLAGLYQQKREYAKAILRHRRALAIREKALGPDHPDVASSLNNLAGLYQQKGEFALARSLHRRALSIRQNALGLEHPDVATSLNNLAGTYRREGRLAEAEPLYEGALSIRERAFGSEHLHVVQPLLGLAELYAQQRDYAKAEPLYERALKISEKALGPAHPDVVRQLSNLAAVYQAKGDYTKVASLYRQRVDVKEQTLTSIVLQALATGDIAWAIRRMKHAIAVEDHETHLNVGSEEQKRAYMASLRRTTDAAVSLHVQFAPSDQDAGEIALTTVLRRKGRVLDAMADSLGALRRNSTDEDGLSLETLRSIRTQYTALVWRGPEKFPLDEYRATLDRLEEEQRHIEVRLTSRSAELQQKLQPITLRQVQAAIPKGAVLVELFRYRPIHPQSANIWGKPRYVAYVIHRHGQLSFADLGEAAPIDAAAHRLRGELSNPDLTRDPTPAARELDALVMQPIRKLLGKSGHILLSPDGALNLVPFAAFVDEHGRYLVERYLFTYLTSGRDVLRLKASLSSHQPPLVLADAAFDGVTSQNPPGEEDSHRGLRSVDMSRVRFSPLPSTADEARAIQQLLPDAQILLGAHATEEAIKAAQRPRILHIATHGFFLPEKDDTEDDPVVSAATDAFGLTPGGSEIHATQRENPLLRSGLGLAGANARVSGSSNDGILTALEVSNLDLDGTELVVLSACETGVGKASSGEGVYGLRRSLVMAGAQTQVMSLWKVDTGVTREMMLAYYQKLEHGTGRSAAMREVQLEMLRQKNRIHPNLWASFIVAGNPASLEHYGLSVAPDWLKLPPGPRGCACTAAGDDGDQRSSMDLIAIVVLAVTGRRRKAGRCSLADSLARRRQHACMSIGFNSVRPMGPRFGSRAVGSVIRVRGRNDLRRRSSRAGCERRSVPRTR